jgi:hypothetical protein
MFLLGCQWLDIYDPSALEISPDGVWNAVISSPIAVFRLGYSSV